MDTALQIAAGAFVAMLIIGLAMQVGSALAEAVRAHLPRSVRRVLRWLAIGAAVLAAAAVVNSTTLTSRQRAWSGCVQREQQSLETLYGVDSPDVTFTPDAEADALIRSLDLPAPEPEPPTTVRALALQRCGPMPGLGH